MKPLPDDRARFTLEECYCALQRSGDEQAAAEHLLGRRHWIHEASNFDERTGDMLPSPISHVCARLHLASAFNPPGKDRLYRIVEHADVPLREILRVLHERLIREHASLPIRAVRELDSASFFALSRRPGRTIREKLSDRPYLWAVERRWTVDSAENRLVKAFCVRLAYLLRTRRTCSGSHDEPQLDDLLATVESWLQSPAAKEIGRWDNLPPTNLLLQHRDYRRVWDAWRWIEAIDDELERDHDERLVQWTTIAFWSIVSRLARSSRVRLLEQPCYLDYEKFRITTGRTPPAQQVVVHGLCVAPLSGRTCGVVTKLSTDKNGNGYGFVALTGGRSAFFHSHMFASASDYKQVAIGTALTFELVAPPDGKLRAERPEVLPSAAAFRVEMDQGSRITLRPPGRDPVEVKCELCNGGVQVRVGQRAVAAELSREAADTFADSIMSAVFKERVGTSSKDDSAAAPLTSPPATLCVVDLCTLRPRFSRDEQRGTLPFRLLWQRWHPQQGDPVELDLGQADAVALGADVTSVSILDLLAAAPVHSPAVLSQAARFFAMQLQGALGGENLIYIVPDATDEFALSTLRRSVNAAFRVAEPLPRSVAAAFSWHSSADFVQCDVSDGDCVLVLDTVGATISATPLFARWNEDLALRLPESAGIYWERCPCAQSGSQTTSVDTAVGVLNRLDCRFPEDVARLCGLQGLVDEGSGVSWQSESGDWYTLPCNHEPAFEAVIRSIEDPWAEIAQGLEHELGRLANGARVFILPAGDVFREARRRVPTPPILQGLNVVHLGYKHDPHVGGVALHRWQERAGDIALWRDHLPELSMRIIKGGRQARFYLVKDVTVAPKRGQAVPIEIAETFELPAGMPDYQFPLLQGSEENELRYVAFLRSPGFPLQRALPVSLRLTYSYGTDTPYDLVFTPLTSPHGGMGPLRVEWRPRPEAADLPADFPEMPLPETWDSFRHYPRRNSVGTRDLFEWVREQLELLNTHTTGLEEPRSVAVVSSGWRVTRDENRYLLAECEGRSVFCRETEFVNRSEAADVSPGDTITLDIVERARGAIGRRVAASARTELWVTDLKMRGICGIMESGLRWSFVTLWAQGRSLVEADAPEMFRDAMVSGTATLVKLLRLQPANDWSEAVRERARLVSDTALLLLSCMHKDAPRDLSEAFGSALSSQGVSLLGLRRFWQHIAFALGTCRLDWQRSLLRGVLTSLRREPIRVDACGICLRILGIAIWRCGTLLEELTHEDFVMLVDRTDEVLRDDLMRVSAGTDHFDPGEMKDHLELLLGLLRTRSSPQEEIRAILAPGRPAARALARAVETIVDVVTANGIPIHSRLTLDVEKPEALDKTPDLLFALKLYLTGDAGARAIRVMEVREDEE